jgi:hypothetical protein
MLCPPKYRRKFLWRSARQAWEMLASLRGERLVAGAWTLTGFYFAIHASDGGAQSLRSRDFLRIILRSGSSNDLQSGGEGGLSFSPFSKTFEKPTFSNVFSHFPIFQLLSGGEYRPSQLG